jgi:hypothetical protein
LVPGDFAGVLVCDRGKSYDAEELVDVAQQKCLAHLLRNAAEVTEKKTGRAREFSRKLKDLLKGALALRAAKTELDAAEYGNGQRNSRRNSHNICAIGFCATTIIGGC